MTKMLAILLLLLLQWSFASACPVGCLRCESGTTCLECDLPALYYLKNGACVKSAAIKCAKIDSNGKCVECLQGNYFFRGLVCISVFPIDNCLRYNPREVSTICEKCSESTILFENKCLTPIANCETYDSNTGLCIQCKRQFKLSLTWKQCLVGLIKNCDYYNTLGLCSECNPSSSRLSTRKTACLPVIQGCLLHSSNQDLCLECEVGLVKSGNSKTCFPKIAGCEAYNESMPSNGGYQCSVCTANHLLANSESESRCVSQLNNCVTYNNKDNKCVFCKDNFLFTSDSLVCLPKVASCTVYEPSTFRSKALSCAECEPGFGLFYDKALNVALCKDSIASCKIYAENTLKVCLVCSPMFELSEDKTKCTPFIPNCATYSSLSTSAGLLCQKCDSGYQLSSSSKVCVKEIADCSQYSEKGSECLNCVTGKRPTSDGQLCLPVIEFCDSYASSNYTSTSLKCEKCAEKFVLNPTANLCYAAISYCSKQSTESLRCDECEFGYTTSANGTECVPRIENCLKLAAIDPQNPKVLCTICAASFELRKEGGICAPAIKGCSQRDPSEFLCIACESGLMPTTDGLSCLASIANCEDYTQSTYTASSLICSKCSTGFDLLNNGKECFKAIANCQSRNSTTYLCDICASLFVASSDKLACFAEIENCSVHQTVLSSDLALRCQTCKEGFISLDNDSKCVPDIPNCSTRSVLALCVQCTVGLLPTSDGKKCLPAISKCVQYTQDSSINSASLICSTCETGLILQNNSCAAKLVIENCDSQNASTGACITCAKNYVLTSDSLACLPLISNCIGYTTVILGTNRQLFCSVCGTGKVPTGDGLACLSEIPNCTAYAPSTKSSTSMTCTSCKTYYEIENNVCVKVAIQDCIFYIKELDTCGFCNTDFYLTDDSKACLPDIAFCIDVDPSSSASRYLTCSACLSSFLLSDDRRKCLPRIRFCLQYAPATFLTNSLICTKCDVLYVVQPNGTCARKVISNCRQMSTITALCTQCMASYIPTTDAEKCLPEVPNCQTYTPSNISTTKLICLKCVDEATLTQDNICYNGTIAYCSAYDTVAKVCNGCDFGKVVTTDRLKCLDPILNCDTYAPSTIASTSSSCQTCKPGLQPFINGTVCGYKVSGCTLYDNLSFTCKACAGETHPSTDGRLCLNNLPLCQAYDLSTIDNPVIKCLQCVAGYMIDNQTKSCVPKEIAFCVTVDTTTGLCSECKAGYRLTDDKELCLEEIANCRLYMESSKFSTVFQCIQCRPGYQMIATMCILKPIPFCEERNTQNGLCKQCIDGKRVTDDGEICLDAIENCAQYAPSSKTTEDFTCPAKKTAFS